MPDNDHTPPATSGWSVDRHLRMTFTWTSPQGHTLTLPHPNALPAELHGEIAAQGAVTIFRYIVEVNPEARPHLTLGDVSDCANAWLNEDPLITRHRPPDPTRAPTTRRGGGPSASPRRRHSMKKHIRKIRTPWWIWNLISAGGVALGILSAALAGNWTGVAWAAVAGMWIWLATVWQRDHRRMHAQLLRERETVHQLVEYWMPKAWKEDRR